MAARDKELTAQRTPDRARFVDVLRTPYWGRWAVCTVGARFPVAMAPLAAMLLGYHVSGGYALGGVLVAAHTLGEAVAAPFAGAAVERRHPRITLTVCLAAEAILFLVVALLAHNAPTVVIVALITLAGAIPAGAPGGLRALLTSMVGRERLAAGLSVDTVINQACWTLAPLLVTALVALWSPIVATAAIAAAAAVGAVAALGLPAWGGAGTIRPAPRPRDFVDLLRTTARTLALTAVLRLALGTMTTVAAPLFALHGGLPYIGAALAAYAAGTAVGGVLYGARRTWPGSAQRHADATLAMLGLIVATAIAVRDPVALVVLYGLAGVLEGPAVIARSLHLETLLPSHLRATGFSLQYAAVGWGFAAGGLLLASYIEQIGPYGLLVTTGLVVLACGVASLVAPERVGRDTVGIGDQRPGPPVGAHASDS